MARLDLLPKYIVRVEGASGCLFQPINDEYSCVLTAKHVIDGNNSPSIIRQAFDENGALVNETLEIIGTPFLHSNEHKDAAIIKIKKVEGIDSLLRDDLSSENRDGYYLCGHPESRRTQNDSFRLDEISILQPKENNYREAKSKQPIIYNEVTGQSGGGILKTHESCILISGIQSRMVAEDERETLGRLALMPLSFFDEIVEQNPKELSALFPPYIASFKRLVDEIFPLSGIQVADQKKKLIQNELKVIAKNLCDDFTPQLLIDLYKDSLLVSGTDKSVINHSELWVSFLELLSINQLHSEQKITLDLLKQIHKSKKLYFTDSKEWISKLEDIYRSDLSEIEKGGLVVVGSTIDKKPTTVEIDKGYIGNICTVPSSEMNISNTVSDPFNDLSIVHIYKFQKHVIDNYKAFTSITSANSLKTIKEVTNGVI
ncbi:ABC-three component system protein [Cytophaga hutchinsonii]|uniref:ABC-three component systems C-terminal domain-containing protein n=1 Tax=Cytophaga hutchinsonii (strain ATCC 33406 / DSM 1761 / CIP 103989 / NBRC 15051 / NCIMB 9469 / D465) TaxID=269798 RepID=A0A6N4SM57_CYTH3|nr:ABC-three component system protein [Cytophaga hutchinsonii]ABG57332.1 conserved hypothetical protein [Cytophaga hutchinsonii ATCC 33406]SFX46544.1 hypothetical protein SAMN04487930_104231 [Cytophaga hutchinsonii ATCC 33406]